METVYHEPSKSLVVLTDEKIKEIKTKSTQSEYFKILALPEHFSPKHLQAIVDGKMKDGDKVLVECTAKGGEYGYYIKLSGAVLDSNKHITLHKVEEKMYTRLEVRTILHQFNNPQSNEDVFRLNTWFEQNVK